MERIGELLWIVGPSFTVVTVVICGVVALIRGLASDDADNSWLGPSAGLAFLVGMGVCIIGMLLVGWAAWLTT